MGHAFVLIGEDHDFLLQVLGYAAGAAYLQNNQDMCDDILAFANRINADNPNWTPHVVREKENRA